MFEGAGETKLREQRDLCDLLAKVDGADPRKGVFFFSHDEMQGWRVTGIVVFVYDENG